MGRFVSEAQPYQRHDLPAEMNEYGIRRLWDEYVAPRGPFIYEAPIVVLVGRWTASMGEGLAIGLDGMGRATVIGTPMAGLRGALYEQILPHTGIPVRIPAERLFHVDGTPREDFIPLPLSAISSPPTSTEGRTTEISDPAVSVVYHFIQQKTTSQK
jgi:carboxyl-terminal processing protease